MNINNIVNPSGSPPTPPGFPGALFIALRLCTGSRPSATSLSPSLPFSSLLLLFPLAAPCGSFPRASGRRTLCSMYVCIVICVCIAARFIVLPSPQGTFLPPRGSLLGPRGPLSVPQGHTFGTQSSLWSLWGPKPRKRSVLSRLWGRFRYPRGCLGAPLGVLRELLELIFVH